MDFERVVFAGHAIRRMFERGLSRADVLDVVREGEVIARYFEDRPYPTHLVLGFVRSDPLHVVVATDENEGAAIVVTAYAPAPGLWDEEFRVRREP